MAICSRPAPAASSALSLAPLIAKLPHLVIANGMTTSHGIAELRLGLRSYQRSALARSARRRCAPVNAAAEFRGLTNRSGRTALCAG
jgi:hypothetical protein